MSHPSSVGPGPSPCIAFLGLFGSPNFGNEATLEAFLFNVRQRLPQARFVAIAPHHSQIERTAGVPLLPLDPLPVRRYFWRLRPQALRDRMEDWAVQASEVWRIRRAARALAGADVLVVPGTGVIDDFGQGPLDLPADIDRWSAAARLRGLPVQFISVGVSAIGQPACVTRFRRALDRASFISFRDEVSARNARAHGLAEGPVVPDLAFSLPQAWFDDAPPPGSTPGPRRVGVGVMGWRGWNVGPAEAERTYREYLARTVTLVQRLMEHGHHVQLLTGDTRADDAAVADLLAACQGHRLAAERLSAPPMRNFHQLLPVLARLDAVVATRYHNLLLSLMMLRPTVSISYADKNDAVMALFGLSSWNHDIARWQPEAVHAQLEAMLADPAPTTRHLPRGLAEARELLGSQYDHLCASWCGSSAPV